MEFIIISVIIILCEFLLLLLWIWGGGGGGGLLSHCLTFFPGTVFLSKLFAYFSIYLHFPPKIVSIFPLSESATLWYKISDAHQHHTTSFLPFLFLACRYVGRKISAPFRSGSGEEVVEKTSVDGQCALSRSKNKKQHADVCK